MGRAVKSRRAPCLTIGALLLLITGSFAAAAAARRQAWVADHRQGQTGDKPVRRIVVEKLSLLRSFLAKVSGNTRDASITKGRQQTDQIVRRHAAEKERDDAGEKKTNARVK